MGWQPDLPDPRDFTFRHDRVLRLLRRLKRARPATLPAEVDLCGDGDAQFFTTPKDQGPLNCSSACAVLGLVEYFERRVCGRTFSGSRLFLYKVTRNQRQRRRRAVGDTGADLRTTLKVLVHFGVPPEEHWPYDIGRVDDEPDAFLYNLAKPFRRVRYFRLDEPNCSGQYAWQSVVSLLAAGFPVAFGLALPTSLSADPNIPYRPGFDGIRGGHAAVAVGYRNHHFGRGQHALRIRSSWGSQWGDNGNGWLPAAYVRSQLARDFWCVVSKEWLDTTELSRPSVVESVLGT
jgi:C1A family cysteine protease